MSLHYPSLFRQLYHRVGRPIRRLQTVETISGEPLLDLQPDGDTLTVAFIRSKPGYEFTKLLQDTLCWAGSKGFSRVKLEDDALFNNGPDCFFRALIYRAFENKRSIYIDRGFEPIDRASVERDLATLYRFPISSAKLLFEIAPAELDHVKSALMQERDGTKRFGSWLLSRSCPDYREVINWLIKISTPNNRAELDLNQQVIPFLEAYDNYYQQHKLLIRTSECTGQQIPDLEMAPQENVESEELQNLINNTLERLELVGQALGNVQSFWAQFPSIQWASETSPLDTTDCKNQVDIYSLEPFDPNTVAKIRREDGTFDCFDPDTILTSITSEGVALNPLRLEKRYEPQEKYINPYSLKGKI